MIKYNLILIYYFELKEKQQKKGAVDKTMVKTKENVKQKEKFDKLTVINQQKIDRTKTIKGSEKRKK